MTRSWRFPDEADTTIAITRQDERVEDWRRAARSTKDLAQARRLLAIALVLDGSSRADAATAACSS